MNITQLEIYTRPTCSDCQELKKFLQNHHIPHKEHDLSREPAKEKDLLKITGSRIVPTLVFPSPSILGWNRKPRSIIGLEINQGEIKKLLHVE